MRVLRAVTLAGQALTAALLVEIGIRCVPLPRLAHLLGVPLAVDEPTGEAEVNWGRPARDLQVIRRAQRATTRVFKRWPGGGTCLRRSLVAGHLLRHQHPRLRLGVAGSGRDLRAHAWLEVDGQRLDPLADEYLPLRTARR